MLQKLQGLFGGALTAAVAFSQSAMAHPINRQAQITSEAPRWCDFAKENLTQGNGAPFVCHVESQRCIRLNNYSCNKNFSATPYEGQIKTADGRPVTDIDHHVVYTDPKYSLSTTIALLRRYYSDLGHTTALSIAETWAPWCDTNGSKLYHLGWGRTCHDGVGAAPASFAGPRCRKPTNGLPLRGQWGPCNCPNEIAEFYVKDPTKG
jgi:hypothetical protein